MILSLKLRCLGPFQLEADGQFIALPTRKTAALLVYLVLHPEAHAREQLCTLFWGDFADPEAQRSLRTALSTLRKTLGETCLLADRTFVQFNPAYAVEVDVLAFRTQAQHFLAQPAIDPTQLDLALYQGDLLDGFYDDWILRERETLRLLYLQALLRLAQHWRTQGDYGQTIEIAQRILSLDPAEEIAHQHLLFCYTATGERKAARQQYEICVRALRDELDVAPSPETTALYRRSQQTLPPKRPAAAAQSNLPIPLASFIGRVHEIARLKALLLGEHVTPKRQPTRLVTVTGPGGCGKTRLAIQVARELFDVYTDGVWWVEFAALSDESQVPQAVAKVLDVQQGMQPSLIDVLITNLRTKQALLVLDNCEHLVSACAELAERLLSHCPNLQILATSRESFGLFGETSWLVPSLTLPGTALVDLAKFGQIDELLQFEGIQLFVERASAVQRNFVLTAANAPVVLQICRQLDGIPLALELAAARVKLMTVEQLATRLTSVIGARFELLTDGSRMVLPRQQTLRATMTWSYALLSEQEQRLLQQCALFAGGWFLEAAEATGADSGEQPVATILARLVDKSLVLAEPQGAVVRYQMLETIRQYAFEQLEKSGEPADARDRHLAYFLHLAEQAEPELRGGGQLMWLRRLDADYENLRAALAWGLQHEPSITTRLLDGAALATNLIFYWKIHGDWTEGRYWLQHVEQLQVESLHIVNEVLLQRITYLRAKALYGAGIVVWHQEQWAEARRLLETSVELSRAIGDRVMLYRAQVFLGDLCIVERNSTAAFALWHECLDYFRQVQDHWSMAETIFYFGYGERRAGSYTVAKLYYEECILLLRALGERWLFSLAISHLGIIAFLQGDYVTAWPQIEQRLLIGREFGLKHHIYTALDFLASIVYRQGDIRQAARLLREVMAIKSQAGIAPLSSLADTLGIIAQANAMDRQSERAVKLFAVHRSYAFTPGEEDLQTRTTHDALLAALCAQLGVDAFKTAWALGLAMTPEQALEEALAAD